MDSIAFRDFTQSSANANELKNFPLSAERKGDYHADSAYANRQKRIAAA